MLSNFLKQVTTALLIALPLSLSAQAITGTIKGQITDQVTKVGLPGATVFLSNSNPKIGTTTDANGFYKLEKVPIGRQTLKVQYIGYEPLEQSNLNLNPGKELIINASLTEQVSTLGEVVIKAEENKEEAINQMATVSARSFSVEESQRYAGARNDVARMATNFAGVRGGNDAQNDIVIRGNSPNGLLWRFEGIDIPNPNHFGNLGATGGPVSMLNNNVLSNSDFMTAAFPAEYGNALSGVFDLKMRNGNAEKHEFLGQVGFNGFELGAEGPLLRKQGGSYLINYRYSTLEVMQKMGFNFGTGTAIPDYQDVTFKVNLPTKKGSLSLFGIGGKSSISLLGSEKDTTAGDDYYGDDNLDIRNFNKVGVAGISYRHVLSSSAYFNATIAGTYLENQALVDSVNRITREACNCDWIESKTASNSLLVNLYLVKKFNARSNMKAGLMAKNIGFNLENKRNNGAEGYSFLYNENGTTQLIQPYVQWQYRIKALWTINTGLHADYLQLTKEVAWQPRVSVRYKATDRISLNIGYGLHAQTQNPAIYFGQVTDSITGIQTAVNDAIKMTKAHHGVFGVDVSLSKYMRLKLETYYQYLYDAPVSSTGGTWSTLNLGGDLQLQNYDMANRYLVNKGNGRNYGVELTLEHFMKAGFYFLTTASVYQTEYKTIDKNWRPTAFANRFVTNGLIGKEWVLTKNQDAKRRMVIYSDAKVMYAGGQRYTSIDLAKSAEKQERVYDVTSAYSNQFKDYFRLDLNVGFRMRGKKMTQEWTIMTQNITGAQNPLFQNYNPQTNSPVNINQLGLFIVPQYKITF